MTKIRITGLEKELERTKLRIGSAIARSKFNVDLQESVIEQVREEGLKPRLRPSTVNNRRYLAKYNPTHPAYREDKSNLTITGKLLDAIRVKFIAAKLLFSFGALKSKHPRYKGKKKRIGKSVAYQELLEIQNEMRPILQVFQNREFKTTIEKKLVTAIKRFFK